MNNPESTAADALAAEEAIRPLVPFLKMELYVDGERQWAQGVALPPTYDQSSIMGAYHMMGEWLREKAPEMLDQARA